MADLARQALAPSQAISPDMIAPELREPLAKLPKLPVRSALFRRVASWLIKLRRSPELPGVSLEVRKGQPATRVYRPDVTLSNGALLWIHGGGYIIGAASIDDALCARFARELGVTVVSAEYGLAPRHAFPEPLDDCHACWTWLLDHAAELGIDRERIAIGGMSAGGGLAAALVQRACDEAGAKPAAQMLMAPMLDDRTAARTELDGLAHPVWDNTLNRLGWCSYLGTEPGATSLPRYAAPARREDLAGLPPAWIGVGSIELFRDEDTRYAQRLETAGVLVTLKIVPGAPHGFEAWAPDTSITREHLASAMSWLRERIG